MRYTYAYTTHCTHGGDARSVRAYLRSSSVTGGEGGSGTHFTLSTHTPPSSSPSFPPFRRRPVCGGGGGKGGGALKREGGFPSPLALSNRYIQYNIPLPALVADPSGEKKVQNEVFARI